MFDTVHGFTHSLHYCSCTANIYSVYEIKYAAAVVNNTWSKWYCLVLFSILY